MCFEQVGFKRESRSGFLDGEVHRVELLKPGFNAQREDVSQHGVGKAAVLVELNGASGVGFAVEVILLETLCPAREGVCFGDGIVEQDGVLGVDLCQHELIGIDLQARDLEVVVDVLRVNIDRALIRFDCLKIFSFSRKRVGFLDERERVARGRGSGNERRVHHGNNNHVEVHQSTD